MGRRSGFVEEAVYAPPPKVGAEFEGPPIGDVRPGRYMVAAIVDLGFFKDDPTRFQVVFRFWSSLKNRWAWEIVGADAIDVGLYKIIPKKTRKKR
jgi:hypothetical protein